MAVLLSVAVVLARTVATIVPSQPPTVLPLPVALPVPSRLLSREVAWQGWPQAGRSLALLAILQRSGGCPPPPEPRHGQPLNIHPIHRIPHHIPIQIRVPPRKQDRILRGPPPQHRVVVPRPEPQQARVRVPEPAGEAEGLDVGVAGDGGRAGCPSGMPDLAPRVRLTPPPSCWAQLAGVGAAERCPGRCCRRVS